MTTYGERQVGLSFNPSNNDKVHEVKQLYARIIDLCKNMQEEAVTEDRKRLYSIAATQAVTAQMWAVKAITWTE